MSKTFSMMVVLFVSSISFADELCGFVDMPCAAMDANGNSDCAPVPDYYMEYENTIVWLKGNKVALAKASSQNQQVCLEGKFNGDDEMIVNSIRK
jgi:hypothetical protein